VSFLSVGVLLLIGIAGYLVAQYTEIERKLPLLTDVELETFLGQHPSVRRNIRAMLLFAAILAFFGALQIKHDPVLKGSTELAVEAARVLLSGLLVITVFLRMAVSYVRFPQTKTYPAKSNLFEVTRRVASVGWFPSGHGGYSMALVFAQVGIVLSGGYLVLSAF
jgi:hypothetical protein